MIIFIAIEGRNNGNNENYYDNDNNGSYDNNDNDIEI